MSVDRTELEQSSVKDRLLLFIKKSNLTQRKFEELTGLSNGYINSMRKSIKPDTFDSKISPIFPQLNKLWVLHGEGEMYLPMQGSFSIDTTIKPSNQVDIDLEIEILKKRVRDLNRKKSNKYSEGTLIKDDDLVEATEYIVPIPGQAGLQKAFFYPDEYIEQNFKHETILVKPSDRGTFLKIEVDGNSMPGVLDPGDWARCEEISKIHWMDKNVFKPKKIYCLFHNKRGILFKRISKVLNDTITLSSDNKDKTEYPDEEFNLIEFSKILIVKKVEKNLDL